MDQQMEDMFVASAAWELGSFAFAVSSFVIVVFGHYTTLDVPKVPNQVEDFWCTEVSS